MVWIPTPSSSRRPDRQNRGSKRYGMHSNNKILQRERERVRIEEIACTPPRKTFLFQGLKP
jgi:hypothetical protein